MHCHRRKAPLIWIWTLLALACLPAAAAPLPDPTQFRVQLETGALDRAREWLDAGLDPDFLGDRIGSGLMIAAWEGNLPLMELFHARGADINKTNRRGETALMHAAWKGRGAAVRWLLDHGARAEHQQPEQWTALHYAVFAGHGEVAERLLESGADINARSPNGSSVLMMAVYEGREDLARWLLARGADTRNRNENGDGALDWAMKFNHTKIARMVSTQDEFRVAASRPKADWGEVRKSEPIPKEIEELLAMRATLASRNFPLDTIDRRIASARARHAREALKRQAPPPAVLEISASRQAPASQRARMVIEQKPQ